MKSLPHITVGAQCERNVRPPSAMSNLDFRRFFAIYLYSGAANWGCSPFRGKAERSMDNVSRKSRANWLFELIPDQADGGNLGALLATALNWDSTEARHQQLFADKPETPIAKGLVGSQPAAISSGLNMWVCSVSSTQAPCMRITPPSSGEYTNATEIVIFNSPLRSKGHWFHLPSIPWDKLDSYIDSFEAVTPEGLTYGKIEQVAARFFERDRLLMPVDDALVDRLDHWRDEAMPVKRPQSIDELINQLFAQMFVLRAIEDRRLAPEVPSLHSLVDPYGKAAAEALAALFKTAHVHLQSELFDDKTVLNIPPAILGGIITDLYVPSQLPVENARYNFAWIDPRGTPEKRPMRDTSKPANGIRQDKVVITQGRTSRQRNTSQGSRNDRLF